MKTYRQIFTILFFYFISMGIHLKAQDNKNLLTNFEKIRLAEIVIPITDFDQIEQNNNFIRIDSNIFFISTNGKEYTLESLSNFKKCVSENIRWLNASKLYLISNSFSNRKIIEVMNILDKYSIKNYRLYYIDKLFEEPEEPIVVTEPKIINEENYINDSTNIKIIRQNGTFICKINNKENNFKTIEELKSFIGTNKQTLNSTNVLIIADKTTEYNEFKELIKVLTDNGIEKFQLMNTE